MLHFEMLQVTLSSANKLPIADSIGGGILALLGLFMFPWIISVIYAIAVPRTKNWKLIGGLLGRYVGLYVIAMLIITTRG